MSYAQKFFCDEETCGVMKKETNHWLLGRMGSRLDGEPLLTLTTWSEAWAMERDMLSFCGAPHALLHASKCIAKWMEVR